MAEVLDILCGMKTNATRRILKAVKSTDSFGILSAETDSTLLVVVCAHLIVRME
jgi:hypothetical protein